MQQRTRLVYCRGHKMQRQPTVGLCSENGQDTTRIGTIALSHKKHGHTYAGTAITLNSEVGANTVETNAKLQQQDQVGLGTQYVQASRSTCANKHIALINESLHREQL